MVPTLIVAVYLFVLAFAVDENMDLYVLSVRNHDCESSGPVGYNLHIKNSALSMVTDGGSTSDTLKLNIRDGVVTDGKSKLSVDKKHRLVFSGNPKTDWFLGDTNTLEDHQGWKAFVCRDPGSGADVYWYHAPAELCTDFMEVRLMTSDNDGELPYRLRAIAEPCQLFSAVSEMRADQNGRLTIGGLEQASPALFYVDDGDFRMLDGKYLAVDEKKRMVVTTTQPSVSSGEASWSFSGRELTLNGKETVYACKSTDKLDEYPKNFGKKAKFLESNANYGNLYWTDELSEGKDAVDCKHLVQVDINLIPKVYYH